MHRVLSWVTSVPLVVSIALILLVFHPIVRVAGFLGKDPLERAMVQLQVWLVRAFRIVALRLDVEATDQIDPERPYLFVANHQSNFDIPLLGATFKAQQCKFVANRNIARGIPSVSYTLRRGGHALVRRGQPRESLRSIREMARFATEYGHGIIIFPEGTRARDGEMLPFLELGTAALFKTAADMPIVPVAIDGAAELMAHALWPTPFRHTVRLWVGDPIERSPDEDPKELLAEVRRQVAAKIDHWRTPVGA